MPPSMKDIAQTKFSRRRRALLWVLATGVLACLAVPTVDARTYSVDVAPGGELLFSPASVSIQVGDTVIWNLRVSGHSVTSGLPTAPDARFDSGIRSSGSTFSRTFTEPGTFSYYCMPHGACCAMLGSVVVAAATPTPPPTAAQPLNISTRLEVGAGDQVLIGGFIIAGTGPKRVILRAIGPSLSSAGVSAPLADPFLELHASDQSLITTNDNWRDSKPADIEATGLAPASDLESALVMTLDPGELHRDCEREGGRDRGGPDRGLRSRSGRRLAVGEYQHARIRRDGEQRHDRRLYSGRRKQQYPGPGPGAGTFSWSAWGHRHARRSHARIA